MNLIANFYLSIAILSLTAGIVVYINSSSKHLRSIFLFFTIAGFYWSFTGFLLRSAITYEEAFFYERIGGFWPICIAVFFHFALRYINKDDFIRNKIILYSLIYGPALLFSFFDIFTDELTTVIQSPFGYWTSMDSEGTILALLSTGWSWSLSTLAVLLIIYYILRGVKEKKRTQATFVLIGFITPVILSTITESFLSLVSFPIIRLTVPSYGIGLLFIGYAIYKYELFQINPSVAADQIIKSTPDLLILTDDNHKIRIVNPAVEEILGYKKKDLLDEPINKLLPKYVNTTSDKHHLLNFEKNLLKINLQFITKKGEMKSLEVSKTVVDDKKENIKGLIFIGRDRSDEIKAELEIKKYVKKLEEEDLAMVSMLEDLRESQKNVQKLNKNLEEKVKERTQEIKQILKQKDEFVNQLGHDLKNPLTPLTTLLPIIKQKEKDDELKKLIEILENNAIYMKNLVVKTIELAKLNSPNITFEKEDINLYEIVNQIIDNQKIILDKKGIKIDTFVDKNLFVKTDKLRLGELLINIVNNAVKYSNSGDKIKIYADKDVDNVKISIQDEGIGMSDKQLKHVFEDFYKADPSRHDLDSSGLGLAICKRIVEKQGGKIWVESKGLNKGTTIKFTLKEGEKANI